MAISLMSNLKIITTGQVPTTANLLPGQAAFGKINSDGKYHLFGNTGEGEGAGKVVDIVLDTYSGVDAFTLEQVLTEGNTSKLDVIFQDEGGTTKVTVGPAGMILGTTKVTEESIQVKGKDVLSASLTTLSADDAAAIRSLISTYSKAEIDGMVAGAFHFKGCVESFATLPTEGNKAGDVYNIKTAGGTDIHGNPVKAGDNVVYVDAHDDDPAGFDVFSGVVDLSAYYTSAQVDTLLTAYAKSAEVYSKTDADTKFQTKADAKTEHDTLTEAITKAQEDATKGIGDAAAAKAAADAAQADATTANTEIGKTNTRVKTLEDAGYQTADDVTQILTDGNYVKDANYVHTDKNYTAADQAKVAKIVTDGAGTKVLKDDGSYDTIELSVVSI